MAYFGVIFFANMGSGGGQNYFHLGESFPESWGIRHILRGWGWPRSLELRVVFPLRGPGKPPGVDIPENWGKITKFPSRSDPPKMGKNHRKTTKIAFSD